MKANPILRVDRFARSSALAACLLVSAATVTISANPDPANPESKPLKDESAKAGQDSKPLKDGSKASGNESRPVQDEGDKANERAQDRPADTTPVEDDSGKASPEARPVEDSAPASGKDSRKVTDGTSNKASPGARRTTDSSQKAGPQAAPVNDGNQNRANSESRAASSKDRAKEAGPQMPATEEPTAFERETAVREAMTEAEAAVRQSKLQIANPDEARIIIAGILAADSPVSRAEQSRGETIADDAAEIAAEIPEQMRTDAKSFVVQRLRGQQTEDRAEPGFFRANDGTKALIANEDSLRFYQSGRRYVSFYSKTSIPAVLLANVSLGNVELQSAPAAAKFFSMTDNQLAVWPEGYRGADAWVVSYPVNKGSMISSGDITFPSGSTRFADTHSYDMVLILADAMKDPEFEGQRFIIEGHTSAEGSFENNQVLSQHRAEAIARELVRNGVPQEQIIPVGYGESEALHPADAAEELRSQDRRVIISRLGEATEPEATEPE